MMSYSVLAVILLVLPVSFVLAVDQYPYCSPGDCGEGEKKGTDGHCIPCDSGTFMNFRNHSCMSCYTCDRATHEDEIIIVNCTDRSNAIVTCKPDYFNAGGNTPDTRSCFKCKECLDNEYVSRNCTETKDTLCIPNSTTSKAVPDDETTSVRNDLSTSETANTVDEATVVGPASNFSTTAPPEAGGDSSNGVLKIVLPVFGCVGFVVVVVAAAVGVYIYRKPRRTGLSAIEPQQVNSEDIELNDINSSTEQANSFTKKALL